MHPEKGFYYHYKHDPKEALNHHAYEVLGIVRHTEEDCRPEDSYMVAYRPLYQNTYLKDADMSVRPIRMFTENVTVDGKEIPRFKKIKDPAVIAELKKIRDTMYS